MQDPVFVESGIRLQRNRSCSTAAVPQIPIQYPAGANIGRRKTVPDLPPGGCPLPQGRPVYVNESVRQNQDLSGFPWYETCILILNLSIYFFIIIFITVYY